MAKLLAVALSRGLELIVVRRVVAVLLVLCLSVVGWGAAGAYAAPGDPDASFNDTVSAALAAATSSTGLDNSVSSVVADGNGGYVIGGGFSNGPGSGAGAKSVFRVNEDGSLDASFNDALSGELAAATGDLGLNDAVRSIAADANGGFLIGGGFSNGPGSGAGDKRVFRVDANGNLDTAFNDALSGELAAATGDLGLDGWVQSIAADTAGGYVIGGDFTNGPGSGAGVKSIFRVDANGSLDTSFNDALSSELAVATNNMGLDNFYGGVSSIAADSAGGYLVGGGFINGPGLPGTGTRSVFRVDADGGLDTAFNDALSGALAGATGYSGLDELVLTVVADGNSGYLIGGAFINGPGSAAGDKRVFRVNADGSLDAAFNNALSGALATATGSVGLDAGVSSVVADGNGGFLIGGGFSNGPGSGAGDKRVFRVNANGSLDTAFNNALTSSLATSGLDGWVRSIAVDGAGGSVIGGDFTNAPGAGAGSKRLIRVDSSAPLPTFEVSYASGGASGGSVPVDGSSPYVAGSTVTVLGNSGSLVKSGFTFAGWSDGSTTYQPGDSFTMPSSAVTLTAVWTAAGTTKSTQSASCVIAAGAVNRAGVKAVTRAGCVSNAGRPVGTTLRFVPSGGVVSAPRLMCRVGARLVAPLRLPASYGAKSYRCRAGVMVVQTFKQKGRYTVTWTAPATSTYKAYQRSIAFSVR